MNDFRVTATNLARGRHGLFRQADINDPLEYERTEGGGVTRRPYEAAMRDFERVTGLDRSFYGSPMGDRATEKYRKTPVRPA